MKQNPGATKENVFPRRRRRRRLCRLCRLPRHRRRQRRRPGGSGSDVFRRAVGNPISTQTTTQIWRVWNK